jgi:hypothetical protein
LWPQHGHSATGANDGGDSRLARPSGSSPLGAGAIYGAVHVKGNYSHMLLVSGMCTLLIGYVALHWTRRSVIAGTRVTQDGQRVDVRVSSEAFNAQVAAPPTPVRTRHHCRRISTDTNS